MMRFLGKIGMLLIVVITGICLIGATSNQPLSIKAILASAQHLSTGPVVIKEFSQDNFQRSLQKGKAVFIVIRSKYSLWAPNLLNTKKAARLQQDGKVEFFDLLWSWEVHSENVNAKPFFDKFGWSKETFVVVCRGEAQEKLPFPIYIDDYL